MLRQFAPLVVALVLGLEACTPETLPPSAPMAPSAPGPTPPIVRLPQEQEPAPSGVDASVHVALGVPRDGDDSDDWLLDRELFVTSYNPKLNAPNWVAWNLDDRYLGHAPRSPGFHSDTGLPKAFYVVRDDDYVGSGYDRGHLCPSADRTRDDAMNKATFVFTNAHPQFHELNAGPWEKLETHERELARQGKEVYIVAGGIFDPEPTRIGRAKEPGHRVAVPRASYKVIVVLERGQDARAVRADTKVIAAIMPNTREAKLHEWTDYAVSIREVERATGYDFLARVPRDVQDVVETRVP